MQGYKPLFYIPMLFVVRTDEAHPGSESPNLSHQPLGFQDVQPMSDDDNPDVHIPSISDEDGGDVGTCILLLITAFMEKYLAIGDDAI